MTIFQSARLKLTFWYLLIIILITAFFSIAFYRTSTRELRRLIDRVKAEQQNHSDDLFFPPRPLYLPILQVLENSEHQLMIALLVIDGIILIFSGGAAYFLAGQTLRPIKKMVEEQDQFISSASHELRTPIATMRAEMEGSLLEKRITDNEARELISSNLEELGRLQKLANNLLSLAKVNEGDNVMPMREISLSEILHAAINQTVNIAKTKSIKLSRQIKEAQIIGDKTSLVQVFVIILDNAIKYSPEKSEIKISTSINSEMATVKISDQGIGISKEDLPHIFKRFYRAEKSRGHDGFGLGLAIAKKIVEEHGGTIEIQSLVNKGSTVIVSLPRLTS